MAVKRKTQIEKDIDKEISALPQERDKIVVKGARQHNLKNIDVEIPRNRLVVITGLSGSGKSSLAFDTIYAEGQRRYVESLSSYARQFLGQMDKPDVDYIDGLSPAISIDQKSRSHNPRSTVGTVTEIYDYLRLLYARVGVPHCPKCGASVQSQSPQEIVDRIFQKPEGTKLNILAPIIRNKKGQYTKLFAELTEEGFSRVRVDGETYLLTDDIEMSRYGIHSIDIVVDRIQVKDTIKQRLTESVELSLERADGMVVVNDPETGTDELFSSRFACDICGISLPEITPKLFSFNSPFGACEKCSGLGTLKEIDPDLVIDINKSLVEEAILPWRGSSSGYLTSMMHAAAHELGIDPYVRLKDLKPEILNALIYGGKSPVRVAFTWHNTQGRTRRGHFTFRGIIDYLERRYRETTSDYIRGVLEMYMSDRPCPVCKGKRLKDTVLAVTVGDQNIYEITQSSVKQTLDFFSGLKLTYFQAQVGERILREIMSRLTFLNNVGLDYITLSRAARTLSGGESQRIRLATQVGSNLAGVLYILDEPSIGLHQRDNARLIETLKGLRNLGNTVIVVEHDENTIRAADHVIDLGPGAGVHGGEIVAQGTPAAIEQIETSPTGRFLKLKNTSAKTARRIYRPGNGQTLTIHNPRQNNLKGESISFPLGTFISVTGVSGSGKSSLVNETLWRNIAHEFGLRIEKPGKCDSIEGIEHIDAAIVVDQSPIGRTPRSNPVTYTKVFDKIRMLFASVPEAKARGYSPGRFSFNVSGGRCPRCSGDGMLKIEMHFLPDVYVQCETCGGKRYNRETLEIKYRGKNIHEILSLTVDSAVEFFANHHAISERLELIRDVGLGYIRLGQPAPTLSGGEAQRVKLASELAKKKQGRVLYILDEPTTGLHYFDVVKLLAVLQRLVDMGNTVVVIEHNLDVVVSSDYVIDLGPEGGDGGGYLVVNGTPEEIAKNPNSHTGRFLSEMFGFKRDGKDRARKQKEA
ncbi:MAG: excinuclease ABC subunit UvrA [bacterium]|nr:excinuclease ABC subunit UvrA [bacterium]